MRFSTEIIHQSLACTPALFLQFLIGIGWGWTAPTLLALQNTSTDFRITTDQAAWLGFISEVGRIIGPFVSPLLVDNIGRKNTLILVSIAFTVIWVLTIFARDIYTLLTMRIVFGIGNGVVDVASPIYITEVCSPNLRGIGGSGMLFAFYAGLIFEFFLTTYVSYTHVAIVNTILSVSAISSTYLAVETTYFLIMKGELERARKNLVWLKASTGIDDELKKIQKNVEEQRAKRQSFRRLFSSATNLKAMLASVGFYLLYSMVGFHTVTPYSSLIFSPSEIFTANEYTILYGLVQLVVSIFSLFVVEKIDRRHVIIYSFVVITCCNVCTAVLLHLHGKNHDIQFYPWLLFFSIALYGGVGSFMAPVAYIISGELLPLSVRAIGGSMAVTASSTGSFITAILFWPITARFGMETNFVVFAVLSLSVVIFVYFAVPETRGKSLHEMHEKPIEQDNDKSTSARDGPDKT